MADFDLNALLSSFSPEDIENLKKTAAEVLGNVGSGSVNEEKKPEPPPPSVPKNDAFQGLSGLGMPDLSQLAGLLPIFNALNSHDERLDFINSLKPLISEDKRQKADEAMKLVRLLSLLPLLRERGIM